VHNGQAAAIVGHNSDEYSTFCYSGMSGFSQFVCGAGPDIYNEAWILGTFGSSLTDDYATIYAAVMGKYSEMSTPGTKMYFLSQGLFYSDFVSTNEKALQMGTDAWFAGGNYVALNALSTNPTRAANGLSVYHYLFAVETDKEFPYMGACHGCELSFVLGFYLESLTFITDLLPPSMGITAPLTSEDLAVGSAMNSYWASFFLSQDPNAAGSGLPTWTPYGGATDTQTMVFSDTMPSPHVAMNPCVSVASCRTEPTKSWRHASKTFWYSSESTATTLPLTCDTPSVATVTHSGLSAYTSCATWTCASWCNVYTTSMSACSTCALSSVTSSGAYCASWCNAYTCGFNLCTGCSACDAALTGTTCYSWCNAFTCGLSGCAACSTCAAITAGTYYASWCNSYTCFLPGNICSGYPGC
jgi:hypothetical protein